MARAGGGAAGSGKVPERRCPRGAARSSRTVAPRRRAAALLPPPLTAGTQTPMVPGSTSPDRTLATRARVNDQIRKIQEHIYSRYIDQGEHGNLDEESALRVLEEHYRKPENA